MFARRNNQTNQTIKHAETSGESRATIVLNRIVLCLLTGVAIACQAQSQSVESPTPIAEVSQPAQASSEATAGQQDGIEYRNEQLGLRFEYPEGYVADDSYEHPEPETENWQKTIELWSAADYQAIQEHNFEGSEFPANVSITVYGNPEQRSLEEWVKNSNRFVNVGEISRQPLAGQEAIVFRSSGLYDNNNIVLSSPDSASIIVISHAEGEAGYQQVLQQAISTFQFVTM